MKKYASRSGITAIPNAAERSFASKLEAQGKTWISQPRSFVLPVPHCSYRPDFFVVEDNCFYEVLGSRQAYSQQREKIDAFRMAYPHLTLKIVNEGAWVTDWNPEVDSRHKKVEPVVQKEMHEALEAAGVGREGPQVAEALRDVERVRHLPAARPQPIRVPPAPQADVMVADTPDGTVYRFRAATAAEREEITEEVAVVKEYSRRATRNQRKRDERSGVLAREEKKMLEYVRAKKLARVSKS